MRILLIWLGIVGCGIANGFLYSGFGTPENFVFVLCSSALCAFLLIIHRRITKDWEVPDNPWTDGFHFPFFRISMFFGTMGLVIFLAILIVSEEDKAATVTKVVSCGSVAVAS